MIKELFKDSARYLPLMAVSSIVGIAAIPVITRLFPPHDYGNYILVKTTASLLSTIAVAWLGSATIRFFPAHELSGELEKFYSVLLKLSFVSIVIVCFAFVGVLFLAQSRISANLYSLMWIGLLVFIVASYFSIFSNILRAKRQVTWYTSFSIWSSLAGFGLGVALVMIFHLGVRGLLWGSLISTVVILPPLWKISLGKLPLREGSIRSSTSLEIAKYGLPAMAINLLSWAQSLFDRYILEFFRGSQEVGIYSASYAVSEKSIFLIISLFHLASTPIAFSIWENQGVEASQKFTNRIARYYFLIGLPATVGLSILSSSAIDILAAAEYYEGYKVVPLVAFGAFLVGIAHRFTMGLAYHKRTDLLMFCYLGSVVLNVGLNFILIPEYGYMAAAGTTFVSYAFLLLSAIFVSKRFFVWGFPFKSLAKTVCASGVMGIVVYPIGNGLTPSTLLNLILGIVIGVIVYPLMLFLLREFKPSEVQALLDLKRKICRQVRASVCCGQ